MPSQYNVPVSERPSSSDDIDIRCGTQGGTYLRWLAGGC